MGRISVVDIATRYGPEGLGFEHRWWKCISISLPYRLALGPTQTPAQWVPGLCLGGKSAGEWLRTYTSTKSRNEESVRCKFNPLPCLHGALRRRGGSFIYINFVFDNLISPYPHTIFDFNTRIILTHSTVQSPSWAADWLAASQEIPRISRNPKVHYRTNKRPPPVPILGQLRIILSPINQQVISLTPILLTWRLWWAPNNANRWQMGFNSAFKGLIPRIAHFIPVVSKYFLSSLFSKFVSYLSFPRSKGLRFTRVQYKLYLMLQN